ncbi:unnamed protein product, partial [Ectocarpus fasciculatus]
MLHASPAVCLLSKKAQPCCRVLGRDLMPVSCFLGGVVGVMSWKMLSTANPPLWFPFVVGLRLPHGVLACFCPRACCDFCSFRGGTLLLALTLFSLACVCAASGVETKARTE